MPEDDIPLILRRKRITSFLIVLILMVEKKGRVGLIVHNFQQSEDYGLKVFPCMTGEGQS